MNSPVETNPLTLAPPEALLQELEGRVHSLEDAVARLEDTHALEERVVARLTDRLPQTKVAADRDTGIIEDRVMARLADRLPPAAPLQPDGAMSSETSPIFRWGGAWTSWLFLDMFREAKLLVQMILDRRYQMAWTTRIVALVLLPAILTTHWWVPIFFFWFPLMWLTATAELCVALVNLVLAFALYKALSREVRRYDERLRR
jgi:hypothetical protein